MAWNPDTYNKFKSERYEPFHFDLVKLVRAKPALTVIDLGCGTGELTRLLADHLPGANVLGIDSSYQMLHKAATFANEQVRFENRSVEKQIELHETFDLVFSTAALQWVQHHQQLFPKLMKLVKPGGQMVVQVPNNNEQPSHAALKEIAGREPFKDLLKGYVREYPVLDPEDYAQLFYNNGATNITVYEKVYPHVLKDADAVFEWVSGTAIIPYIEKLRGDVGDSFRIAYRHKLRDIFPGTPVFYPFKRILMCATF